MENIIFRQRLVQNYTIEISNTENNLLLQIMLCLLNIRLPRSVTEILYLQASIFERERDSALIAIQAAMKID